MSRKLEITPEAERDIFVIASDIHQKESLASARHAVAELKTHLCTLAELHDSSRAGGCDGTREAVMSGLPFIAIYKTSNDLLTIVRVLYGAEERRLQKRK